MAIDYSKTAKEIVHELGGDENIINVTHCATRLRFILSDASKVNKENVSKIQGVITVVEAGGQFQIVIGNHVKDAYEHVLSLVQIDEQKAQEKGSQQKVGIFSKLIDIISSIFAPFLYTLAACGILQGILGVLTALDWMDPAGGTYRILNFVSWTGFTFLPVMIAVTAAKKFNVNVFIAVVSACALVNPDFINMITAHKFLSVDSADPAVQSLIQSALANPDTMKLLNDVIGIPVMAQPLDFFGIPVQMLSYTSSVIPIILSVWILSYLQRFFEKILPTVIRNLFTPLLCIAIIVPLTLLVFGPIGSSIGGMIGDAYNFLYNLSPIVAGAVIGGFWQVLVIFGVHWGITPVTVGNYATLGYDTFTALQASAVFAQAGAAFGVFLKIKDQEMKNVSLPAAITGLFGITEPAIYGVTLRLKYPLICGCIAGAVGGAIAGAFKAVSWGYNMPGIATLPAYFKEGYGMEFVGFIISIAVAFSLGIVLTYMFGVRENKVENKTTETIIKAQAISKEETNIICSPMKGHAIPVREVKDAAFASEMMGKGVGIIPAEGKVYAPFSGKVSALFPTNHAIGLTSNDGVEVLIHIGIDTVNMNGEGFTAHVAQDAVVERGQLLISFDKELITTHGYDNTTIFIVTNADKKTDVMVDEAKNVEVSDQVIQLVDIGERVS
ncbi:MAG: beta-glucoside-specific PTS transporter subunit IIABC [Bacillus sp. (in: firmicutes)]